VIEWAENLGEVTGRDRDSIRIWLTACGDKAREIIMEGIDEDAWNNM
jgi:hypothetical protein